MDEGAGSPARLKPPPNVIQTNEVGGPGAKTSFIAMEYLEGQPLKPDRGLGSAGRAGSTLAIHLRVLIEALGRSSTTPTSSATFSTAKKLQVVPPRYMTPHNVFVSYSGQVKGRRFSGSPRPSDRPRRTRAGVLKGKARLPWSPEQALGDPVDRRADIFSRRGVMLWEALTDRRLFPRRESDLTVLQKIVTDQIPRPPAR